jgi:DNA mismatch repair protein MutS
MTPMLKQYWEIKNQYPDCIVFYRMGDFYEMFYDDAVTAAPILEVQLTARDKTAENPIPMCGVPHHSAQNYFQKLLNHGYKIALCEQTEDPAASKGLVKRDVVRVMTPGFISDPELTEDSSRNLLFCVTAIQTQIEVLVVDLLKAETRLGNFENFSSFFEFCHTEKPSEFLLEKKEGLLETKIAENFSIPITYRPDFFDAPHNKTFEAVKKYFFQTQKSENFFLKDPQPIQEPKTLKIDAITLASLEILSSHSSLGEKATLYNVLDYTQTSPGRRLLKDWLSKPSTDFAVIESRLSAVESFIEYSFYHEDLRQKLKNLRDLERLTTKTALNLSNPRDLLAIRDILRILPEIQANLFSYKNPYLKKLSKSFFPLENLCEELNRSLLDELPFTAKEGGLFKPSYHPEISELRELTENAKAKVLEMEAREKQASKISSLKIKYSKVFGYVIEISKSYLDKVPPHYTRKQTISTGERYITEELKNLEDKILSADQKLCKIEEELFLTLRSRVKENTFELLENAFLLAQIDVLQSFGSAAKKNNYKKPQMHKNWDLHLEKSRHPVIESLLKGNSFIPNNISFEKNNCQSMLITGPNMSGKSTLMRQLALITIMAHAGSFVPADSALIPIVDAVYTRIGSSDDLAQGQSTFMVEMSEMARITKLATSESLILIDEIGRGTSTYDGLSLAWSILEYLHETVHAKTIFSTHYHELTQLENKLPHLKNFNVSVKRWKEDILFLHQLRPGSANQSYGIDVAKLAKLPDEILIRAKKILTTLEQDSYQLKTSKNKLFAPNDQQLLFFEENPSPENPDNPH